MSNNSGGPAFPTHDVYEHCGFDGNSGPHVQQTTNTGMALRDYFAAKALQGLLANSEVQATHAEFAAESYKMADAMLKAREVGNE